MAYWDILIVDLVWWYLLGLCKVWVGMKKSSKFYASLVPIYFSNYKYFSFKLPVEWEFEPKRRQHGLEPSISSADGRLEHWFQPEFDPSSDSTRSELLSKRQAKPDVWWRHQCAFFLSQTTSARIGINERQEWGKSFIEIQISSVVYTGQAVLRPGLCLWPSKLFFSIYAF